MRLNARFVTYALLAGVLVASVSAGCGSSSGTGSTSTSTTNTGGHGGTAGTTSSGTSATNTSGGGHGGAATTSSGTGGTPTSSGTGGTPNTSASGSTSSGTAACVKVACQGKYYQCGDCIDNDGDGKMDQDDPDCLGPCDNTESNYYGGIPGQSGPKCAVDCYFDQDSGAGNDDCHWDHRCDPLEVAPDYHPESWNGAHCKYDTTFKVTSSMGCDAAFNSQSQACTNFCLPLTPNGCDCFGCCELPAGSGKFVWLGSEDGNGNGSCDIAGIGDPSKCQPCTPVPGCFNGCGHCEICIGKPTLPADCMPPYCGNGVCDTGETCANCETDCGTCPDGGMSSSSSSSGSTTSSSSTSSSSTSSGGSQCGAGVQACGQPGQVPCASGYYCVTGCCQKIPG